MSKNHISNICFWASLLMISFEFLNLSISHNNKNHHEKINNTLLLLTGLRSKKLMDTRVLIMSTLTSTIYPPLSHNSELHWYLVSMISQHAALVYISAGKLPPAGLRLTNAPMIFLYGTSTNHRPYQFHWVSLWYSYLLAPRMFWSTSSWCSRCSLIILNIVATTPAGIQRWWIMMMDHRSGISVFASPSLDLNEYPSREL